MYNKMNGTSREMLLMLIIPLLLHGPSKLTVYSTNGMGGDQCQNLQLFLFSTKIICIVKFYIQMTRSLLFAWWSSTYKIMILICTVKFYDTLAFA